MNRPLSARDKLDELYRQRQNQLSRVGWALVVLLIMGFTLL